MPPPRMYPGDYLLDGYLFTTPPGGSQLVVDTIGDEVLHAAQDLTMEFGALVPRLLVLDSYYRGNPPLPSSPARMTDTYKVLVAMSVSNWCSLVVDVVDERLRIDSIRSTEFPIRDETAWAWWQANNMDSVSSMVHVEALKFGYSYVTAWAPSCVDCPPVVMGESPLNSYAVYDDNTGTCLEAIRTWFDRPTGRFMADYTTPDYQFGLVSRGQVARRPYLWGPYADVGRSVLAFDLGSISWTWRSLDGAPMVRTNPLGVVPYVRMRTKPDLVGGYQSEIEPILPIQDRINQTTFDRLLAQEFAAFPQRWV